MYIYVYIIACICSMCMRNAVCVYAFASSEVDKAALELAALELGLSTQPWRIILSESGITTVGSNFSTSKLVEL